jgi:hypothetical protein
VATGLTQLYYQRERLVSDVPGYTAGVQLKNGPYIALSATELAVYFPDDVAAHYDLEGRLQMVAEPNSYRRRGLSHRVLLSRKLPAEEGGGIARELLPFDAGDALVAGAHEKAAAVHAALVSSAPVEFAKPSEKDALAQILPVLERAAKFNAPAARHDAERFRNIYGRVAILPPDQYNSLVLQLTEGCAYTGCLFCELYRGVFYGQKNREEFRQHLEAALAYHGEGLRARRSIFLGEANALALPQRALVEIFKTLNERFEFPPSGKQPAPADWWLGSRSRFDGVSSFLDAFTGKPRSASDFRELRQLGLRRVYIGVETGDDKLLKWLCKPATAERVQHCVEALKSAQIAVGAIVLLGPGGRQFSKEHIEGTAGLLNRLPFGKGDYIYFSPLVVYPGSRYAEEAGALGITPLSAPEMLAQEEAIGAALRFGESRGKPYIARYDLETFVY